MLNEATGSSRGSRSTRARAIPKRVVLFDEIGILGPFGVKI
jgi:hypothetical protein